MKILIWRNNSRTTLLIIYSIRSFFFNVIMINMISNYISIYWTSLMLNKWNNLLFQRFKWISFCNIINSYTTMSIPKIRLWYWSKSFLPSSVPNLHFYDFIINFQSLYFKINTYCAVRIIIKYVIWKSQ